MKKEKFKKISWWVQRSKFILWYLTSVGSIEKLKSEINIYHSVDMTPDSYQDGPIE